MPGRLNTISSTPYRFGFNGKENDNEVKGTGNSQDYGMRIYDTRLGKFLSVDPLTKNYPELTPYQFASNTPIQAIDLDGLEQYHFSLEKKDGQTIFKSTGVESDFTDLYLQEKAYYVTYKGATFRFTSDKGPGELSIAQLKSFVKNPGEVLKANEKELNEFLDGVAIGAALNAGSNNAVRGVFHARSNVNTPVKSQATSNNNVSSSGVKKIYIDKSKYPQAAKHIEDAQAAGKPLGGVVDRGGADARRKAALKGVKTENGQDRDEYPPAILNTGGSGASVRLIDKSDNRGAGSSMGHQLSDTPDGTNVEIHTVPTYNVNPR